MLFKCVNFFYLLKTSFIIAEIPTEIRATIKERIKKDSIREPKNKILFVKNERDAVDAK